METSRRIDGFVARARRQEQQKPPPQAPTWAVVALGLLLLVGLAVVVASGQPALYAFVAAMVGAGVLERVLDGRAPSWGEGHVVADIESDGVMFRTYRGAVALAVLFFVALAAASVLFVVVWTTPGLDLPRFFGGFAILLFAGLVYAVRLIVRSIRRVDIRVNADGVTAVRVLGACETVRWSSLLAASPRGRVILLTTSENVVRWPTDRLRADPVAVATIIDRCAALDHHDRESIVAIIEEMFVAPAGR
ncbi:hypothetical protein [Microbacterium sp. Leaf320]|uniref:hypothetical protein n=1 Tax=Microbacterium sp. Leaf320 TaxID=1736334 RepID=UPI0006F55B03|nr:hypothetical protein [Microbacterium sp. Leaf320]KQQ66140.1 hypothetical protein ASF63_12555 [Microbacterium sp. Leaf320]